MNNHTGKKKNTDNNDNNNNNNNNKFFTATYMIGCPAGFVIVSIVGKLVYWKLKTNLLSKRGYDLL